VKFQLGDATPPEDVRAVMHDGSEIVADRPAAGVDVGRRPDGPMIDAHPVTGELLRCGRCRAPMVDVDWVEIRSMGDREPSYVAGRARCPTKGCGTTCPICRREPGDIHSGACSPFVLTKLVDPCRVSREDCRTKIE
jgi:hypothetical protein